MVKHENFIKIGNALSVLDKNIENFSASYPTHSMVLYVAVYQPFLSSARFHTYIFMIMEHNSRGDYTQTYL